MNITGPDCCRSAAAGEDRRENAEEARPSPRGVRPPMRSIVWRNASISARRRVNSPRISARQVTDVAVDPLEAGTHRLRQVIEPFVGPGQLHSQASIELRLARDSGLRNQPAYGLGRLRGHRPDGDEVGDQQEGDETRGDPGADRGTTAGLRGAPCGQSTEDGRGNQDEQPRVGDHEADVDPGQLGVLETLLVENLGRDAKDEVGRNRASEQGAEAEPGERCRPASPGAGERREAEGQRPHGRHPTEDVEEEPEVGRVRASWARIAISSDPGFQIITTSRATTRRARRHHHRDPPTVAIAESSPLGWNAALTGRPVPWHGSQRTIAP